MPTIEEALQYLGIDEVDAVIMANVKRALKDAESYLKSAVDEDVFKFLPDDPKVGRLVLTYLQDLYDERGTSAKAGNAKRAMVQSMELQLKMELARARDAAEGVGV